MKLSRTGKIVVASGCLMLLLLTINLPVGAAKTRIVHSTYVPVEYSTNALGVAQPNKSKLEEIMQRNSIQPENLVLIDLRGEPHIFINDTAYYLKVQPFDSVQALLDYEDDLADKINAGVPVYAEERVESMDNGKKSIEYLPIEVSVGAYATTEQRIAKELGTRYIRIANVDGAAPDMKEIYEFIRQVVPLMKDPNNSFIIHCNAGRGRTSFFSIILDMLVNAKTDDFDTILARQGKKFEKDFSETKVKGKQDAKRSRLQEVYNYIVSNEDNFQTPPPGL